MSCINCKSSNIEYWCSSCKEEALYCSELCANIHWKNSHQNFIHVPIDVRAVRRPPASFKFEIDLPELYKQTWNASLTGDCNTMAYLTQKKLFSKGMKKVGYETKARTEFWDYWEEFLDVLCEYRAAPIGTIYRKRLKTARKTLLETALTVLLSKSPAADPLYSPPYLASDVHKIVKRVGKRKIYRYLGVIGKYLDNEIKNYYNNVRR